jgi:hypothetical protein
MENYDGDYTTVIEVYLVDIGEGDAIRWSLATITTVILNSSQRVHCLSFKISKLEGLGTFINETMYLFL